MRRAHVQHVTPGPLLLDAVQTHHLRDVLRLTVGDSVEVFDDIGRTAVARIAASDGPSIVLDVADVRQLAQPPLNWTIASAVPKGNRADWMVEKLSEIGAAGFVPLAAERSVVLPEGEGKRHRWQRLATESAKQSHRCGVMSIGELMSTEAFLAATPAPTWYFSTAPQAISVIEAAGQLSPHTRSIALLIGPEGGWTQREIERFAEAGATAVSLGPTVLRIETAAVAVAALVAAIVAPMLANSAHAGDRP